MKSLVFLLAFSITAYGIDANVIFVKGQVEKSNLEGKVSKLVKGDFLQEGYSIKTGSNAIVILKIEGHSNHRIEQNSEVFIEDLPYKFQNSNELEQGGSIIMKTGTIFSEILSKSDIPTFTVKTKNTIMGVRGTVFMASVDHKTDDVFLVVKEGQVEIENAISNLQDVVQRNQTMIVEKDVKPAQQKNYQWTKKLQWNIKDSTFENAKSFVAVRPEAIKLHQKRGKDWIRNELSYKNVKSTWHKNEDRWFKRTESLKPNTIRQKRQREVYQKLKGIKSYFRKTMLRDKDPKLNQFLEKSPKKVDKKFLENRFEKHRLRRKLIGGRLPPLPINSPLPTTSPTPTATNPIGGAPRIPPVDNSGPGSAIDPTPNPIGPRQ